jgi:hypothetical protein
MGIIMAEEIKTPDALKAEFAKIYKDKTGNDAPHMHYVKQEGLAEGAFWTVIPGDLAVQQTLGMEKGTFELRATETWKVARELLTFPGAAEASVTDLQAAIRAAGKKDKSLGISGLEHAVVTDMGDELRITNLYKGVSRSYIVAAENKDKVERGDSSAKLLTIPEATLRAYVNKQATAQEEAAKDGSGIMKVKEDDEPETKVFDPVKATREELITAFAEKAGSLRLVAHKDMVSGRYADMGKDKPGRFVFIIKKEATEPGNLAKLGLSEKTTVADVMSWEVPAATMKKLDAAGMASNDDLRLLISNHNPKKEPFTGLESAIVSGDWKKGFTVSNLLGGSRSSVFGANNDIGEPQPSKASKAIVVSEEKLRQALGAAKPAAEKPAGKSGKTAVPAAGDEGFGDFNAADLAALVQAERQAGATMTADDFPVDQSGMRAQAPKPQQQAPTEPRPGLLSRIGLGRNRGNGGAAQGKA